MADIQKAETSDMSIDELSAAIDEHMKGVSSPPKKPKKSSTPVKEPESKIKIEAKPAEKTVEVAEPKKEDKTNKPRTKSSRIEVRKSGYITNDEDESDKNLTDAEEPDGRISSGKRNIKPMEAEEKPKPTKTSMVDVVVKQSPSSKPVEPKLVSSEVPKEDEKEAEAPVEKKEEESETSEQSKVDEEEPASEKPPVQEKTKLEPETSLEPAAPLPPKRSNEIEELTAQIGEKEEEAETPPKSDTLKAFDTKQYHIPIKPSHHHRAGSSFMVFAAVLAGILAVIFVLNELEIIDIAALVYTN